MVELKKSFTKFMILITLFNNCKLNLISLFEITHIRTYSRKTNSMQNVYVPYEEHLHQEMKYHVCAIIHYIFWQKLKYS